MTGKVKMYNEERGYGFIAGEDGTDYFVHASAVSSAETLYRGANVSFDPGENERGKIACKVSIVQPVNRPAFIQFGDVRIKLSNIKNYGISSDTSYYMKIYEYNAQKAKQVALEKAKRKKAGLIQKILAPAIDTNLYEWKGKKKYITSFSRENAMRAIGLDPYDPNDKHSPFSLQENPDGSLEPFYPPSPDENDFLTEVDPTLYVTTYQGDNFRFVQGAVDFDVHEKCSEIDSYML